ncbi:mitogen-activated protein kinase maf1 [Grosmannia clavigera kw1407]|uniref:Mitogen-activated protein kinase maf1 n=1 Tax=Grosmannia clavigera (strain kw1407 / UAMH 11150) TaxID=655863 RepID=F0XCP4_GROCL|nr:mitogen-activated protein kinase maf1 [Grosmannia clavigera kw1407]EFX04540.1 mitogen-activated protein kinase maf1 [Grosmannia clavigera kw1407]
MKFIPLRDFDIVASALNFDTADCHVTGGCDLYTTKAAGSDKKLYKNIDKSLESQHAALLKLGASLSPPQRESLAVSHNLSRSSPFGNLAEISSRRTFAYLIATLNASHPDYDFSHVLRPADFRRERNLRLLMSTIDSTLSNMRPNSFVDSTLGSVTGTSVGSTASSTSPPWGPQMWALINKEMHLQDCTAFSYQPADNPFDEEDGAIWALHYFFFSKSRKRVAYLYVRGVPVLGQSPLLLSRQQQHRRLSHFSMNTPTTAGGGRARFGQHRGSRSGRQASAAGINGENSSLLTSATKRPGIAIHDGGDAAGKRARYWLGDQADQLVSLEENGDEDEDAEMQDVLFWKREDDSDTDQYFDDAGGFLTDDDEDEVNNLSMDEQDEDEDENVGKGDHFDVSHKRKGPVRAMSEDIAARMDM